MNVANKMAEKKKNASQSGTVPASARREEKEQSKNPRAATREREERKEREHRASGRVQSRQSQPSVSTRLRTNRIVRFVRDSYHELRYKVTWPTFEEARNMTIVVIALSAAVGLILGAADLGLSQLFKLITGGY